MVSGPAEEKCSRVKALGMSMRQQVSRKINLKGYLVCNLKAITALQLRDGVNVSTAAAMMV